MFKLFWVNWDRYVFFVFKGQYPKNGARVLNFQISPHVLIDDRHSQSWLRRQSFKRTAGLNEDQRVGEADTPPTLLSTTIFQMLMLVVSKKHDSKGFLWLNGTRGIICWVHLRTRSYNSHYRILLGNPINLHLPLANWVGGRSMLYTTSFCWNDIT